MLTRSDFNRLAAILREQKRQGDTTAPIVARWLSAHLQGLNHAFNPDRFLAACGEE